MISGREGGEREVTDDVRRKQNCQDDHGWQGKCLLVVTGQASFHILTLGGKAICKAKLQEAGEGASSVTGEKESESSNFCVLYVGSAHAWKTCQPPRHLWKDKALLSHLRSIICHYLSESISIT